jgi:two-component system LytT family response regulator
MKRLAGQLRVAAPASHEQAIVVTTARGASVLPLRDIDWIEAADNYARIWTAGRSYLLRESLQQLEQRVRLHGFARAHRRALVRLAGVRELTSSRTGGLVAVLDAGVRIRISRRRRAAFAAAVRQICGSA